MGVSIFCGDGGGGGGGVGWGVGGGGVTLFRIRMLLWKMKPWTNIALSHRWATM